MSTQATGRTTHREDVARAYGPATPLPNEEIPPTVEANVERMVELLSQIARDSGRLPIAVGPDEAARLLGVSRNHFDRNVLGHIRSVKSGRRRLIRVAELERWMVENEQVPLAWELELELAR